MRLLCAAALSLSFGLWLAFAQDTKPTDPKARAAKLAERKKKFEAEFKDLQSQQEKTEDPAAKQALAVEMRELVAITLGKMVTLAEENPGDDAAFEALAFVLQMSGQYRLTGEDTKKALALVIEHHAANAKVKDVLPAALALEGGDKLLAAVLNKATDKEVRAVALVTRGGVLMKQADEEEDDEKKQEELAKAAIELFERAVKEAPEAKIGTSTVAKVAATRIESAKAITALAVGKPAPDVESLLLDGKKTKLSDYKGKVVLLDVWATWCGPCRAMIPHERDLVKKMKDKPFTLVSVSVDNKKETLQKFMETEAMPWVHWWDNGPKTKVMDTYRVKAFPTMYLIDHSGVIRYKWVGSPGNEKLDAAIEALVKVAEKAKG
jgi:peroxiredoxin